MRTLLMVTLLMFGIIAWTDTARAQETDTENLAKQTQNPVSSLISVPFESNINFNAGPEDKTDLVLNIKPVYPVNLSDNWNLIHRAILPVLSQGARGPGQGRVFGLGDFTYQGFLTPAKTGKLIWGVGPQMSIPTGMDRLSSNQWTLGPAVLGLFMPGH